MVFHGVKAFVDDCGTCAIHHRAVCAKGDADEMAELESVKFYRRFQAGQTVVFAGDEMKFVASVVTGVATLTHTMEDGRRQMTGLLLPSDFIGRPGRTNAAFEVTAVTDMLMCCFNRKPFEDLLITMPHLNQRLLEMALDELDAAREWMLLLGCKSALEKVASLVALIGRRSDTRFAGLRSGSMVFDLPLTRIQMADYLGITLETVCRQMTILKRRGVISLTSARKVLVPDFSRLLDVAGDDADGGPIA